MKPHAFSLPDDVQSLSAYVKTYLQQHPQAQIRDDSRLVQAGDLFFAVATDHNKRTLHLEEAQIRGAALLFMPSECQGSGVKCEKRSVYVHALAQWYGFLLSDIFNHPSHSLLTIGITGTNGKTSCSYWLSQLLSGLGCRCAWVGTLGMGLFNQYVQPNGLTTPTINLLQSQLALWRTQGVKAVAMEASSHGLDQGRLQGIAFDIAVLTNLSQDHLDYHQSMPIYQAAKARLFDWPGLRYAVINCDDPFGAQLSKRLAEHSADKAIGIIEYSVALSEEQAQARSLAQNALRLLCAHQIQSTRDRRVQFLLAVYHAGQNTRYFVDVPILGLFNVQNLLAVIASALAADFALDKIVEQLPKISAVPGRMQCVSTASEQPLVIIDFAHTPDALEKALTALMPIARARGGRLVCVVGCGGNRDTSKRPLMGKIASECADLLILTSDNPREEDSHAIIKQMMHGIAEDKRRQLICIEQRAAAIFQAITQANAADIVLLAGKGHETTQEIKGKKIYFSDQQQAQLALTAYQNAYSESAYLENLASRNRA